MPGPALSGTGYVGKHIPEFEQAVRHQSAQEPECRKQAGFQLARHMFGVVRIRGPRQVYDRIRKQVLLAQAGYKSLEVVFFPGIYDKSVRFRGKERLPRNYPDNAPLDRKRVVEGKRVGLGGWRRIKKKKR